MNNSPESSQLQRHRLSFSRGVGVLASIGLVGLLSSSQAALTTPERSAAHSFQLPLTFEINQGQTDDRVDFLARGPGYNIYFFIFGQNNILERNTARAGTRDGFYFGAFGASSNNVLRDSVAIANAGSGIHVANGFTEGEFVGNVATGNMDGAARP